MTNNDTSTLNGSLQELGETMAANLTTMGVPSTYNEGLTTLAGKILNITPGPIPASISLSADKSILSYADSESATLSATVLDSSDNPIEGVSVEFFNGSTSLGTSTTNSSGVATKSYSSSGAGDISFTAEVGSLVSETYVVEDCRFFDVSSSENVSKYGSSSSFSYDSTEQAYYISTSSAKNITRDSVVGDFDFEISMDFKASSNAVFYVGESNGSNYECQGRIVGSSNSVERGVATYYTNGSIVGRINKTSYSLDTNKWYHYKVTREDNVLTAQILDGDTVIATATDNNVTGTTGNVSWHNYVQTGTMYWKNIKFKPL